MSINPTDKAIDVRDLHYFTFLSNLQGNILKGHGRNFTNNIFLSFTASQQSRVKVWLQTFAQNHVTSALTQLKETEQFKRNGVSGGIFSAVYISALGYTYLGNSPAGMDPSFKNGMKKAQLNDPPVNQWEKGFQGDIHMMILVADADSDNVSNLTKSIIDDLTKVESATVPQMATILTIEYGNAIRNANGDGLEHFGYVDGISQPLFLKDDVEAYNRNLAPTYNTSATPPPPTPIIKFNPSAQLDLVVVADPFAGNVPDAYGSYFVFRKLEQHVRGFKLQEQALATSLGLTGDARERAGAMIVGRFEDGTPVTSMPEAGIYESGITNNFNYTEDADGAKCPFLGHVRKVNPRLDPTGVNSTVTNHMMARRGIPFGQRGTNPDVDPDFAQMPEDGVGLLFMSFQHSLADQFEFIQKSWANNPNFPSLSPPNPPAGKDPIIGQVQTSLPDPTTGSFAKKWEKAITLTSETFPRFVAMKGGEYFFAPSIPYLNNLVPPVS